uniref:Si:ch211-62a1.3 n=1 Tax=Cyprinus carpio TaxID=7962 RepID=A0A8C2JFJ4_CYPCA
MSKCKCCISLSLICLFLVIIQYIYFIFSLVWLLMKLKVSVFLLSACAQTTVADIVFLVDGSSSIGPANFQQIREFLSLLIENFEVAPDRIRIGLVQYTDTPYTEFLLSTYQNKEEILSYIENLSQKNGGTLTGKGLEFMLKQHFVEKAGSRAQQNVPQIAIVITDGDSQDEVDSQAQELRQRGIKIFAIGIKDANKALLRQIASEPYDQHVYKLEGLKESLRNKNTNRVGLAQFSENVKEEFLLNTDKTRSEILSSIRSLTLRPTGKRRIGNAIEYAHKNFFSDINGSRVSEGFKQFLLVISCMFDVVADIAFIVDQSSSIRSKNFNIVRNFLKNTIGGLDMGEGKIKIAVVLYSDFPRADVYFNTFDDKTDILRYISSMPYGRGKTYTGAALKFAKEHVFTKGRGSRRDHHVQQVAVVITDGKSTDKVAGAAAALRRSGVTVFALGIKDTEEDDLREIASYPYKKFVFSVKDFDKLNSLSHILTKTIYSHSFELQDCKQATKADIYFLLDESGSISYDEFDDMKNFTKQWLEAFEVGNNHVRFGLVKFASRATIVFRLHDYNSKADLEKAVNAVIMQGGGTRTDLGLRKMIPLFEEAVQTRGEKVRKLLIVITDGESRGTEEPVEVPAKLLRTEQDVAIYAIGVKNASVPELELISGSPQRKYFVKNYDFLNEIKKNIYKEICVGEKFN